MTSTRNGECAADLPTIDVRTVGLTRYADALALQRALMARRKANEAPNTLILTEHAPVFTLGNRGSAAHLLVPEAVVAAHGIDLVRVERGGDITYHGPGQLVAYPILDLRAFKQDVRWYIRALEETAIRLLATYDVPGERHPGTPGVWSGSAKIASVGVYLSRWVTMHGIAINIAPDLSPFRLINPCGLVGMEMTSVARITGDRPPMAEACNRYAGIFRDVFGCRAAGGSAER